MKQVVSNTYFTFSFTFNFKKKEPLIIVFFQAVGQMVCRAKIED